MQLLDLREDAELERAHQARRVQAIGGRRLS
jgi:hypothetical protein